MRAPAAANGEPVGPILTSCGRNRRELTPPVVPELKHELDTRYFGHYPENAVALNDSRDNDDNEGDGDEGEFQPDCASPKCGQKFEAEDLFGSWDREFGECGGVVGGIAKT